MDNAVPETVETTCVLWGFPSEFWAGLFGAIVGGVITVLSQIIVHKLKTSRERQLRSLRKELLKKMLDKPGKSGWRTMEKLSGVIGATRDETAALLIEIGARRSTGQEDVWAYLENKPLPRDEDTE